MKYFHATFAKNLPSIQEKGLGGDPTAPKNFDCEPGVYLCEFPSLALGFLLEKLLTGPFTEKEFPTPKEAIESLRIIEICPENLDPQKLHPDPQIHQKGFWRYQAIIPIHGCPILTVDDCYPKK